MYARKHWSGLLKNYNLAKEYRKKDAQRKKIARIKGRNLTCFLKKIFVAFLCSGYLRNVRR